MVALEEQNPEISEGVWKDTDDDDCGAGDQASAKHFLRDFWASSNANIRCGWYPGLTISDKFLSPTPIYIDPIPIQIPNEEL